MTSGVDLLFVGYVVAFGAAALACFASVPRVRRIGDRDTRRGLAALLLTSGGWASAHVGFLLAPGPGLKYAFYLAGLVVGFSTLGPWLYFCSAYTGRSLHRNPTFRRLAVGVFLGATAVKLANPWHGLYFSAELVATPFPHLAVHNGLLHWLAMGLAYALSAVGYFMLLELFTQVDYDTRPLVLLVAVTGLPILLDVAGVASPLLLDINYEPLGVAAFAVGVGFVFLGRFQTVQLATEHDDPVVVVDEEDRIRDHNAAAAELFPELADEDVIGEPLRSVLPAVAERLASERSVLALERDGVTRYYQLTGSPLGAGSTGLGRLVVATDITERERYRRELERQNERLEQFASMVSHDLRNPLNVADGRLELAREDHDDENLDAAVAALERMEALIEDLLALARQGQPIDETEPVELSALVERCWGLVETGDADLELGDDATIVADPDRLQQLIENLLRNAVEHGSTSSHASRDDAVEHGGTEVTIRAGATDEGFYLEDDGSGIPADEREDVFESGYSTAEAGTGFGLAIVREIAEAHGWEIAATESEEGGARFEVTGVERA